MLFPGKRRWRGARTVENVQIFSRKNKPESLQVRKWPTTEKNTESKKRFQKISGHKRKRTEKAFVSFSGSLSLEAAFVLPMVLFFFMTLFSFFTILQVQIKVQRVMETAVSKAAGAALYQTDTPLSNQAISLWYIEQSIQRSLKDLPGFASLDFSGSEVDWEQALADIKVTYSMRATTALFPMPSLKLSQRCRRKLWIGLLWQGPEGEGGKETIVYITKDGTVYHRSMECTYLRLSTKSISLSEVGDCRNISGEIYRSCELCRPDQGVGGVYITNTGNRYHGSLSCRGLKRQVRAVPITEVEDKGPCSRCGSGDGE
ncbi:MAG: hypothetical protein HFI93_08440 [Lachnospiraceae bacterium]|nr:hypothetical protein [Lachnospiraceae bacterium]